MTQPALSLEVESLTHRARSLWRCRVLRPLLRVVKNGVSPKRLAWSLSIALLVGINPLLGTTTVLMLLVAWLFNLNYIATQIGIHIVSPLQWLLFLPFVDAGIVIFRTHRLPMNKAEILHLSHRHPLQLIHLLWQWEWHALIVWAVFSGLLAPVLTAQIRRMLVSALRRHKDLIA